MSNRKKRSSQKDVLAKGDETMVLLSLVIIAILIVYAFFCKISCLALLLYIKDTGTIPKKEEVDKYTKKAVRKMFWRKEMRP